MTRDQDEFDDLMEAGAIRLPEKGEKVAVDIENIVAEGDAATTKTSGKSGEAAKPASGEKGSTKTSANAGTTTHGSTAGEGGDGNDLV